MWWQYALAILATAIIAAGIYAYGLIKSQNKQRELLSILYGKGQKAVTHAIKKNGPMSAKDLRKELNGLQASLFYSKNRLVVQDPQAFAKSLLSTMVEKGLLTTKTEKGVTLYDIVPKENRDPQAK